MTQVHIFIHVLQYIKNREDIRRDMIYDSDDINLGTVQCMIFRIISP
jgi:hypothetical protein